MKSPGCRGRSSTKWWHCAQPCVQRAALCPGGRVQDALHEEPLAVPWMEWPMVRRERGMGRTSGSGWSLAEGDGQWWHLLDGILRLEVRLVWDEHHYGYSCKAEPISHRARWWRSRGVSVLRCCRWDEIWDHWDFKGVGRPLGRVRTPVLQVLLLPGTRFTKLSQKESPKVSPKYTKCSQTHSAKELIDTKKLTRRVRPGSSRGAFD